MDTRVCCGVLLSLFALTSLAHCEDDITDRHARFLTKGHWTAWSAWTVCSAQCGDGSTFRVRHCEGSNDCQGNVLDQATCHLKDCQPQPVDGAWTTWASWNKCSHTCGTGVSVRIRLCNNPAPVNGGANCVGDGNDFKKCNLMDCPQVQASWALWGAWSACSASCGTGTQLRVRTCANGTTCQGKSIENQFCTAAKNCPIDGDWSAWSTLLCSSTCGAGTTARQRQCDNPPPQYGGKDCVGNASRFEVCNIGPCSVDGNWTVWSSWSDCRVVCGEGHRHRARTCDNPAPQDGGKDCVGESSMRMECNNGACPTDIRICDKVKTLTALATHTSVSHATEPPCSDVTYNTAAALVEELCGAPVDKTTWKLGSNVIDQCELLPLYVALGYRDVATSLEEYGILLDCLDDGIEVASQNCSSTISRISEKRVLNVTNAKEFRLLLW